MTDTPRKGPGGTRRGAGRPAETGVTRKELLRVLVTDDEKAALTDLAPHGNLSALLRRAPHDAVRWRTIADRLAEALASGDDEEGALGAYVAAATPNEAVLTEPGLDSV